MADLYRDLVRILRANGCYLVRKGKGSHEIWFRVWTHNLIQ